MTKKFIKVIISLVMLTIVFLQADLEKLQHVIRNIPAQTLVIVFIGYVIGQFLSAFKWWLIVRYAGIDTSFKQALKAYFLGMYVNCFGLGTVGGDLARGILVAGGTPKKAQGVASVLVDRIHGLCVLGCIALCAGALWGEPAGVPSVRYLLLGLVAAILCVWIIGPEFFLRFFPKHRFTAKLQEMCTVLPRRPGALFAITLVAIAFHLLQLSLHIPISIGVGTPLTFSQILTTIPIVNIVSTLPISWQGLGVRENAYRFFLAGLLAPEAAIAFGAIWFVAVTLASAIGGIVAAVTGDLKKDLTAAPLVTRPSGSLP
jgi:uncharacterized membrane protein YbhN (UPF0104 family)